MLLPTLPTRRANTSTATLTLALDLDGVCGDYTRGLLGFIQRRFGIDTATFPTPRTMDLWRAGWGIRDHQHFLDLHAVAVEDGLFATMPVIPGAAAATRRLSDAGVHIRILTHRLYVSGQHQRAVTDTITWLDAAGIVYRDVLFCGDKDHIAADVFLDDSPHQITALRAAGKHAVIFDTTQNRDLTGPRVHGWAEATTYLLDLAGTRRTA